MIFFNINNDGPFKHTDASTINIDTVEMKFIHVSSSVKIEANIPFLATYFHFSDQSVQQPHHESSQYTQITPQYTQMRGRAGVKQICT